MYFAITCYDMHAIKACEPYKALTEQTKRRNRGCLLPSYDKKFWQVGGMYPQYVANIQVAIKVMRLLSP